MNAQVAPFATTLAERVATIAMSRQSGAWGTYYDMGIGAPAIIDADGSRFIVSRPNARGHWSVAMVGKRGFFGEDTDLETAVQMVLDA